MTATTIALSLISHTNVGKTALSRTLLGRDVGEVRDAPHVTTASTGYPLQDTPEGDALVLWDTPGFGDSARLARRLAQQGNPIGWFLSQVWDRYRDRAFHLSQLAARNVRDEADVVLYLVNAAEAPADAGYLGPELEVLAWIGRPTIVLLNQTGAPRTPEAERAQEDAWRAAVGPRPFIRAVLTLDAFARCWVQEIVLLRALAPAIDPAKREAFARLAAAWQARRRDAFDRAITVLATPVAAAARDRVALDARGFADRALAAVRDALAGAKEDPARREAAALLAQRLDAGMRDATDRLIVLHGLDGHAAATVRERLAGGLATEAPLDAGKAAMLGGVVSGALSGLAADLAAGGLTLGAGTLVGAIAGALGGAGLARGYNAITERTRTIVRWDREVLDSLVASALLTYLAVAHFGRGRGAWTEGEYPPHWRDVVGREVAARADAFAELWSQRDRGGGDAAFDARLAELLEGTAVAVLDALYPGALDEAAGGAGDLAPSTA